MRNASPAAGCARKAAACLLAFVGLALPSAHAAEPLLIGFDSASAPTMYVGERHEAAGMLDPAP